jgi:hypothetical protein
MKARHLVRASFNGAFIARAATDLSGFSLQRDMKRR